MSYTDVDRGEKPRRYLHQFPDQVKKEKTGYGDLELKEIDLGLARKMDAGFTSEEIQYGIPFLGKLIRFEPLMTVNRLAAVQAIVDVQEIKFVRPKVKRRRMIKGAAATLGVLVFAGVSKWGWDRRQEGLVQAEFDKTLRDQQELVAKYTLPPDLISSRSETAWTVRYAPPEMQYTEVQTNKVLTITPDQPYIVLPGGIFNTGFDTKVKLTEFKLIDGTNAWPQLTVVRKTSARGEIQLDEPWIISDLTKPLVLENTENKALRQALKIRRANSRVPSYDLHLLEEENGV